jgi:hypothetical protein
MLGYECDCSYSGYEPNRAYLAIMRKARKQHQCVECGRTIESGELHEVASGINSDGAPFRYRTCLGCYRIRQRFCSGGWFFGEVTEQVRDCLGFDFSDDPSEWDEDDVDEEDRNHREMLLAKRAETEAL